MEKMYRVFNPETNETIFETDYLNVARIWLRNTGNVIQYSDRAIDLINADEFEATGYFGAANHE